MSQSKTMSTIEVVASTLSGMAISLLIQICIFWCYNIEVTLQQNLSIVVIFTAASVLRSFVLRRIFNRLGEKPVTYIRRKFKWTLK